MSRARVLRRQPVEVDGVGCVRDVSPSGFERYTGRDYGTVMFSGSWVGVSRPASAPEGTPWTGSASASLPRRKPVRRPVSPESLAWLREAVLLRLGQLGSRGDAPSMLSAWLEDRADLPLDLLTLSRRAAVDLLRPLLRRLEREGLLRSVVDTGVSGRGALHYVRADLWVD